ncbi:hypothetical protein JSY14_08750 [Brachybacterium sp. EF45031]|uniref:hypothetical protein n=1 Tax=Brachybacterium sillae TaxID=2810536 RepID=UPI00217D230C|nr:hypothetical protein [Brachybacterium sillae]MCS6712103.1 hypothetical protein [Brachybacterium sillae]
MTTPASTPEDDVVVVVGISDTSTSAAALRWGLHQLDLHGRGRLVAVRAWRTRALSSGTAAPPGRGRRRHRGAGGVPPRR